jgi:DNA processing protein
MEADPRSALLFVLAEGSEFSRSVFAGRNRVVVALASAVLVAQAALPSGSHGTGKLARARDLPVAVFPGTPGCAALAADGAHVVVHQPSAGESIARWLRAALSGEKPAARSMPWPSHLRWLERELRSGGGRGLRAEQCPDPLAALCALSEAESLDLVHETAPGCWALIHEA